MNVGVFTAKRQPTKPVAPAGQANAASKPAEKKGPKLLDFINSRDFTGAVVLAEFLKSAGAATQSSGAVSSADNADQMNPSQILQWLGYSAFHLGDYQKALDAYKELLRLPDSDQMNYLYGACCCFYLGRYTEAEDMAMRCHSPPNHPLQLRILLHIAARSGDDTKISRYAAQMSTSSIEDQLSLAAAYFTRNRWQDAIDLYKPLLLEHRQLMALQVFIALCYYKLDYFETSNDVIQPYLQQHPDSAVALNVKACNLYKLYDGKSAESEVKRMAETSSTITDSPLLQHNLAVFQGGDNAPQVMPPLIGVLPEARINLVIHYLRRGQAFDAFELIKDMEPQTAQEYITKAVVFATGL